MGPNYQNVQKENTMAVASAVMGALSMLLAQTILIPFFLGSLAIIIAILSKGTSKKLSQPAMIGMATSIASLLVTVSILAGTFWKYENDPAFRKETDATFKEITGYTFEDYYKLKPFDMNNTINTNEDSQEIVL